MRRHAKAAIAVLLLVASATAGCSEKKQSEETDKVEAGDATATTEGGSPTTAVDCDDAEWLLECLPEGTSLEKAGVLPDSPTEATGEPIKIGTINQQTGAAGAFPELTLADQAAIAFVNTELGGVDGRPLELVVCDTAFSPAGSQQCAQQMVQEEVVAVIGGIDVFGDGITVLEQNGIPFVGGIPVSFQSVESPISFQFSGGSWGAFLAFADYAITELDAKKVSIMYGEFGSITDAAQYAQRALEAEGIEVKMVPFPIITNDYLAPLTAATEGDPDAIMVGTADTGCVPTLQGLADLGYEGTPFWVGACLAPKITEAAGYDVVNGRIFNTEGPSLAGNDPDVLSYLEIIDRYSDAEGARGAGTVTFRATMNLYVQLRAIGGDDITPETILEQFRAARDVPSFMGHPYTCDGEQLPGLPSMCAPHQMLGRFEDGDLPLITDWIDVGARAIPAD